jgi:hypothetical protein
VRRVTVAGEPGIGVDARRSRAVGQAVGSASAVASA